MLVSGRIRVQHLFDCDEDLLAGVRDEALAIVRQNMTAGLAPGHPTFDYVRKWDPKWAAREHTIYQYSVFNSHEDYLFFDEDHHWFEGRRFNSSLKKIPEFYR